MKSSTGQHFVALDHVRALAALMVVVWHFGHAYAPYPGAPIFPPMALFDEGHTGVSLFMVLSGYLFAKLLAGKQIAYGAFLRNRALRLLPLLVLLVIARGIIIAAKGQPLGAYLIDVAAGVVAPTLPDAAWSITVEFHFYLILPALLLALRRSPWWLVGVWAFALTLRALIFQQQGTVVYWSYWTLIGRIDQFLAGILAFHLLGGRKIPHWVAATTLALFSLFYAWFDTEGGYWGWPLIGRMEAIWIYMPTIEAVAYGVLIAWYDGRFQPRNEGLSALLARIGVYSYSIYMIHRLFLWETSKALHLAGFDQTIWWKAALWSLPYFAIMVILAHFTYRYVELPFLRRRNNYVVSTPEAKVTPPPAAPLAVDR